MKVLIIILLTATVIWAWRSGSPAPEESGAAVAEASRQAPASSFQGRWRNDHGNNFTFRENGSFQMTRRMEEDYAGVKIAFSAGMRGKWQQQGENALMLTVEKVESVTVLSTNINSDAFQNSSKADTAANQLRKDLPQQFTQSTEGSQRSLGLKWQGSNQLVLEDEGASIILTRVE